jgi:hypothetical protein
MKLIYRLGLLVFLFSFFVTAQAQVIRGALIGGLNISQVDGDEVFGFHRFGANFGAAAIIPFNERWSVSLETSFSQEGSYQSPQYPNDSVTGEYDLRLNYVRIPLLVHYNDKDRITAGLGMSVGRLVGVSEKEHGKEVLGVSVQDGPYEPWDFSGVADIRFRIYQKLHMNIRYTYSFVKIRTRDFYNKNGEFLESRNQYNNVLSFRLIYIINDRAKTVRQQKVENNTP